jgi:phosphohistidine phosphatase
MDLYLVRHAWAGDRNDSQWPDDDLRPLTNLGKKRFAEVAAKLANRGMEINAIATSPLIRCVQTAEILADVVPGKAEIVELDALRPGSNLNAVMLWTTQQAERHQNIVWVGHTPDLDRMTAALIAGNDGLIHFAKGGAAAVRFDGPLEIGAGELRWLVTAKILGC